MAIIDPRLGRRPQIDPKSANFPICALLPRVAYEKPRSKNWRCDTVLDQGKEGSCVGHGFAHELLANPFPIKRVSHTDAVRIYNKAKTLDDYLGTGYSGTSVLAGVKAVQELYPGTIESYRWATTLSDVIATIGYHGPCVVGVNWYSGMYQADAEGYVRISGSIAGGHCGLLRSSQIDKARFLFHNSWGLPWGKNGCGWIPYEDFDRLLNEGGDCCVIITRGFWKKS